MFSFREKIDLFIGRIRMGDFASREFGLKNGLANYAVSFVTVAVLLSAEAVAFTAISGFLAGNEVVALGIGVVVTIVGLAVVVPVLFVSSLVAALVWGSLHYLLASRLVVTRGSLKSFNGSMLTLFSSILLVQGLAALVPLIGWFLALLALPYGLVLVYRLVKERFGLEKNKALIVVLVPVALMLLALLALAVVAALIAIGMRFV